MKAGFLQNKPQFGDVPGNLSRVEHLIGQAQADLIVLPELFATGYQFASIREAQDLAEPIPDGPTTRFLLNLARHLNTFIVAGIAEQFKNNTYNSAVILGPDGYIGTYRKTHLFDSEKDIFQPGNKLPPVYLLGEMRVGVMICFDWRFPEVARILALKGADVIAHPSNLVLPHCPQAMITRCLENRVYAITADRVGTENRIADTPALNFIGQSQVVDPNGEILHRASETGEELVLVDIDLQKARNKSINSRNDLFSDRRQDLYSID